jgi:hypothetical protein
MSVIFTVGVVRPSNLLLLKMVHSSNPVRDKGSKLCIVLEVASIGHYHIFKNLLQVKVKQKYEVVPVLN